jgi:triphosphoribosyl-dephospho-CoA synthetase
MGYRHEMWLNAVDKTEGNSLEHYASKYYDPKKRHEYYMRTRKLKGRLSAHNGVASSLKGAASSLKGAVSGAKTATSATEKQAMRDANINSAKQILQNKVRKAKFKRQMESAISDALKNFKGSATERERLKKALTQSLSKTLSTADQESDVVRFNKMIKSVSDVLDKGEYVGHNAKKAIKSFISNARSKIH